MKAETAPLDWRAYFETLQELVRPEHMHKLLVSLAATHPDVNVQVPFVGGFLAQIFVLSLGLIAAFGATLAEAPKRLTEMAEALSSLDFETGLQSLSRKERKQYRAFVEFFGPFVSELGQVMARVFTCYVTDDYDLRQDANELMRQAEQLYSTDPEAARHQLARAGAMGLRGVRFWWRWQDEIAQPLQSWTVILNMLISSVTLEGKQLLGPAAVESPRWQEVCRKAQQEEWASEEFFAGPKMAEAGELDELIEELYNGPEALTQELRAAFAARAEQAIPRLITVATDDELWPEDAPGEGYVPIHALRLLGELRAVAAVPALIDIIADSEPEEFIYDAAFEALESIGAPAAPAILETLRYSRDMALKTALAPTLGEMGTRQAGDFETLAQLYHQATWEEGRTQVVWALGSLGDKRAIPLLRKELADLSIPTTERRELYDALLELGAKGADIEQAWHTLTKEYFATQLRMSLGLGTLTSFMQSLPRDTQRDASTAAHTFTFTMARWLLDTAVQSLLDEPARATAMLDVLEGCVRAFDFAEDLDELKGNAHRAAKHVLECAGPQTREELLGALAALRAYAQNDYKLSHNPNQLLVEARQLLDKEPAAAWAKVGQAGALALRGKRLWSRWPVELNPPASHWAAGVENLVDTVSTARAFPLLAFTAEAKRKEAKPDKARPATPPQEPPDKDALLHELFRGKEKLRPEVSERFRSAGAAVIPLLLRILNDRSLVDPRAEGKGLAPGHAAHLLGELNAGEAAPHLVDAVADMPPDSHLTGQAADALVRLGSAALPAIGEYLHWSENEAVKALLRSIVALIRGGKKDIATSQWMVDDQGHQVLIGFDAQGRAICPDCGQPLIAGADGRLVHTHKPAAPHVGRNDPCPCGSGKKYKHCCMKKDLQR